MSLSICPWKYGKRWVYSITYDEALADLHRFRHPHARGVQHPRPRGTARRPDGARSAKAGNSSYNGYRHMNAGELRDLLARGWGVGQPLVDSRNHHAGNGGSGNRPRQASAGGSPRRTDNPLLLARQQHKYGRPRPRSLSPLRLPRCHEPDGRAQSARRRAVLDQPHGPARPLLRAVLTAPTTRTATSAKPKPYRAGSSTTAIVRWKRPCIPTRTAPKPSYGSALKRCCPRGAMRSGARCPRKHSATI